MEYENEKGKRERGYKKEGEPEASKYQFKEGEGSRVEKGLMEDQKKTCDQKE